MNKKDKKLNLTAAQADSLMELGNIGSGNAVVALSKLLNNQKIEMSLTGVNLIPFNELSNILGNPNVKVFGIFSQVKGETDLSIIQIYTTESIIEFVNTICQTNKKLNLDKINSVEDLNDTAKDFILEVGSILAGAYCSALANLMKIKLIPEVPILHLEAISSIANNLIKKYSEITDSLVMINTKINLPESSLKGIFCFIPSIDTLDNLFRLLKKLK
ncbi:MAG: hypothetical protein GF383_03185 [Candidatus Lokiarchaeota archaeon]|nr:hypothetical protein [Candidatus Lokiarchaeota archaeon]MBD3338607.1 hypothetical protein [Candidatus Lokiarchaeota archaeon]